MAQYCLFNFRPDAFFMVYNIFVAKIDQNHKKSIIKIPFDLFNFDVSGFVGLNVSFPSRICLKYLLFVGTDWPK